MHELSPVVPRCVHAVKPAHQAESMIPICLALQSRCFTILRSAIGGDEVRLPAYQPNNAWIRIIGFAMIAIEAIAQPALRV